MIAPVLSKRKNLVFLQNYGKVCDESNYKGSKVQQKCTYITEKNDQEKTRICKLKEYAEKIKRD